MPKVSWVILGRLFEATQTCLKPHTNVLLQLFVHQSVCQSLDERCWMDAVAAHGAKVTGILETLGGQHTAEDSCCAVVLQKHLCMCVFACCVSCLCRAHLSAWLVSSKKPGILKVKSMSMSYPDHPVHWNSYIHEACL